MNVLFCWAAAPHEMRWATYKQWADEGFQVAKGEKGTMLVRWVDVEDKKAVVDDDAKRMRKVPKVFFVFHAGQLVEPPAVVLDDERVARDPAMLEMAGATIVWGQPVACFSPVLDRIEMPARDLFKSDEGLQATLAHELVHWTGGAGRLGRAMSGVFGSPAYALEELVADMGAAFVLAGLGLRPVHEPREDHAPYLRSWVQGLKEKPSVLWTVAADAQRAAQWLVSAIESAVMAEERVAA
jgi:antirestriction protein ArdC